METSSFTIYGNRPNGVSIARWNPCWFTGERYIDLAPPVGLIKDWKNGLMQDDYTARYYSEVIEKINLDKVLRDLDGKILLCYEPRGEFCHRRIFAEYVEKETGVIIPEWSKKKTAKKAGQLCLFERANEA